MFGEGGNGGARPVAGTDKGWFPVKDPTVGVSVDVDRTGQPVNRLVTIGDSMTHGFMSAAIFRTDLSWPAVLAFELGSDWVLTSVTPCTSLRMVLEDFLSTSNGRFAGSRRGSASDSTGTR